MIIIFNHEIDYLLLFYYLFVIALLLSVLIINNPIINYLKTILIWVMIINVSAAQHSILNSANRILMKSSKQSEK